MFFRLGVLSNPIPWRKNINGPRRHLAEGGKENGGGGEKGRRMRLPERRYSSSSSSSSFRAAGSSKYARIPNQPTPFLLSFIFPSLRIVMALARDCLSLFSCGSNPEFQYQRRPSGLLSPLRRERARESRARDFFPSCVGKGRRQFSSPFAKCNNF